MNTEALPVIDVHTHLAGLGTAAPAASLPSASSIRSFTKPCATNSAFTTPGRVRWISRFLREEGVVEKLVHGSDYPVPPSAWWSLRKLGWSKVRELQTIWSYLARDVEIKRACGFPDVVFTNAVRVIAAGSLARWSIVAK